jgi:hypothetical protein
MTIVTADDLTLATVTTAQTLTLCNLVAGDSIVRVEDNLVVPFENTADPTNNTTTRSVGDTATGATKWTAATESNKNGTSVPKALSSTAATLYTAADALKVTLTPKTGTALNVINKGELHVFFGILRPDQLSKANTVSLITTK